MKKSTPVFVLAIFVCIAVGFWYLNAKTGIQPSEAKEETLNSRTGEQTAFNNKNYAVKPSRADSDNNSVDSEDTLNVSKDLYSTYFNNYKSNILAQALIARKSIDYCLAMKAAGEFESPVGSTASPVKINKNSLAILKERCRGFDLNGKEKVREYFSQIRTSTVEYYDSASISQETLSAILKLQNPVALFEAADGIFSVADGKGNKQSDRPAIDYRKMGFEAALCREGLHCEADSNMALLAKLYMPPDKYEKMDFESLQTSIIERERGDIGTYIKYRESARPIIRSFLANGDINAFIDRIKQL